MSVIHKILERVLDPKSCFTGPRDIPRIILGCIFLGAVFIKSLDPLFFFQVINQFQKVPIRLETFGYSVVFGIFGLEFLVGILALINLYPRLMIVGALFLNGIFVGVLALHWGEELALGCGCFGFPMETVVGVQVFWKNFFLLAVTLAAAFMVFTEKKKVLPNQT